MLGSLLWVQPVAAQAPERFLRINGVYPASAPTAFTTALELPLYGETAVYDIRQEPGNKIFYDATIGERIWRDLAVAISVSFLEERSATVASGSIPSPLFFDRARTASSSAALYLQQVDVHVQAVYFLSTPSSIDIALSGGPSVLRVRGASVSSVTLGPEYPPFETISIAGLGTSETASTGIGANIGADIALMLTRVLGVGVFVRYVTGSIDAGSQKIDGGGLQAGAGLRFRF